MKLSAGWNMISLPVTPYNATLSELFKGFEVMYRFVKGSGYVQVEEDEKLQVGDGYWILVYEDQNCILTGQPIYFYKKTVSSDGWEMLGGCTFGARPKANDCDIGVIYKYVKGTGYKRVLNSEAIESEGGYWILLEEVMGQCQITMEAVSPF